jgi:hypothetical protein
MEAETATVISYEQERETPPVSLTSEELAEVTAEIRF